MIFNEKKCLKMYKNSKLELKNAKKKFSEDGNWTCDKKFNNAISAILRIHGFEPFGYCLILFL